MARTLREVSKCCAVLLKCSKALSVETIRILVLSKAGVINKRYQPVKQLCLPFTNDRKRSNGETPARCSILPIVSVYLVLHAHHIVETIRIQNAEKFFVLFLPCRSNEG
jgi:hypothetical protein